MEDQISDIENYLVNFQKEINEDGNNLNTSTMLYTSNNILSNGEHAYKDNKEADSEIEKVPPLKTVENNDPKESDKSNENAESQQNSGTFQAVTLVPSEIDENGELRYMLIPINIQPDGTEDSEQTQKQMSVFDFVDEPNEQNTDQTEEKNHDASNGKEKTNGKEDKIDEEVEEGVEDEDVEEEDDADEDVNDDYDMKVESIEAGESLKCNYCSFTSTKKFVLSRHIRTHSTERPFKCEFCTYSFKTKLALNNHTNTHKGIRPSKCKECDASFTTTGELLRHVRYKHTYEKPHRCMVCNYASVELSKLRRHVRSHTGERPYKCPECPYASPDTFKLKRHLRVHTGERPYECDICGMKFTQSNSLKSHRLIHSGSKPIFQCELCPSTCTRKTDLRNHVLRIHTSDKPLLCKKCGKNFPDRYTYKIHSRTHDGQKCFKCELCPYSSSVHRHLENHMLTHTGERPFECFLCGLSFRQKTLLARHCAISHKGQTEFKLRTREKVHKCKFCDKAFANEGSMQNHVLRCHEDEHEPTSEEKKVKTFTVERKKRGRPRKSETGNSTLSRENDVSSSAKKRRGRPSKSHRVDDDDDEEEEDEDYVDEEEEEEIDRIINDEVIDGEDAKENDRVKNESDKDEDDCSEEMEGQKEEKDGYTMEEQSLGTNDEGEESMKDDHTGLNKYIMAIKQKREVAES